MEILSWNWIGQTKYTVSPWDAHFWGNGKTLVAQNLCNLSYLIRQRQEHQITVQLKVFSTWIRASQIFLDPIQKYVKVRVAWERVSRDLIVKYFSQCNVQIEANFLEKSLLCSNLCLFCILRKELKYLKPRTSNLHTIVRSYDSRVCWKGTATEIKKLWIDLGKISGRLSYETTTMRKLEVLGLILHHLWTIGLQMCNAAKIAICRLLNDH